MIVLVGGFGDSRRLHDALKQLCADADGLRLICPPHPQAAIAKGAAFRGLSNITPSSRRCRRHYGFCVGRIFRPGVDPGHMGYKGIWSGDKYCRDRMNWQIAKGAVVEASTTIEFKFIDTYDGEGDKVHQMNLYSCSTESAPDYKHDMGKRSTKP